MHGALRARLGRRTEALMSTQARIEGKARSFGENIESDLASRFLRVVEVAAIASARTMGQGEGKISDRVAVEAMRRTMDTIPMHGTIVIGEGERDQAPMLYIGEKVGAEFTDGREVPVLDRPRHEKLIADIRGAGARIRLIGDGDLSAGIAAAVIGTGVHAVMGSGGAPEGVITAAAIRCLNGYMVGRLVVKPDQEERLAQMGIKDKNRIYEAEDLAPGKQLIFAATGVTEGALLKGVRFFGEGTRTSSVILTNQTGKVRFIESIHLEKGPDVKVRFA